MSVGREFHSLDALGTKVLSNWVVLDERQCTYGLLQFGTFRGKCKAK